MKYPITTIATTLITTSLAMTTAIADEYQVTVTNLTPAMHFTPLIVAAHSPGAQMFASGTTASSELQAIAEGGDTSSMNALLESIGASIANGDGLVAPGASASFTVNSSASNSVLSLTSMLLPTNDGFVGLNSVSLPDGPVGSSKTYNAVGYDAGTEANDELVGGGAPGVAGFPAPPPIVATGTGTGGSGIQGLVEGFVHVHKGTIGDLDSNGGVSDINQAVHGWLNPVARITITRMSGDDGNGGGMLDPVNNLTGQVYSSSAVEIFWQAPASGPSTYDVYRDGQLVTSTDGLSFFDSGLSAGTEYKYSVRNVSGGNSSADAMVNLTTNAN